LVSVCSLKEGRRSKLAEKRNDINKPSLVAKRELKLA
jgi:hypothetical protein